MTVFNTGNNPITSDTGSTGVVSGPLPAIDSDTTFNVYFDPFTVSFRLKLGSKLTLSSTMIVRDTIVDSYARRKVRQQKENPSTNLISIGKYPIPCREITLQEYLDGKNNYLQEFINNNGLSENDWFLYVSELVAAFNLPKTDPARQIDLNKIRDLLKSTGLLAKLPGPTWNWFNFHIYDNIELNSKRSAFITSNLPKALFNKYLMDFILPHVNDVWPTGSQQQLLPDGTLFPSCDTNGICCLYDFEEIEIAPGLLRKSKVLKKCITNISRSECLAYTKQYIASQYDMTPGNFDGADYYNDNEIIYGCDLCKNPVHVVYCEPSDVGSPELVSVPYLATNLKADALNILLDRLNDTIYDHNIQIFTNITDAKREYNKRVKSGECQDLGPKLTQPEPPTIELLNCDNNGFTIRVIPSQCNEYSVDYVKYDTYIDGQISDSQSILWNPTSNDPSATADLYFNGNYLDSEVYVVSKYGSINDQINTIKLGPQSRKSNTLVVPCPTPETTPTPIPTPTPTPFPTPTP